MTPEGTAVAEVAKVVSRKSRRYWRAWDHDREMVVRHAARIRVQWAAQWPAPRELALAWQAHHDLGKASKDKAQRQMDAALAAAWLYQHLKSSQKTLEALVLAIEEAYRLGREAALEAVAAAGLTTPLGTQALEALTAASKAGRLHDLTSRLAAAEARQLRRLAAALADDYAGENDLADLIDAIDSILGDGAWVDVLTSTEAQTALIEAADSVYLWAAVEFKEFITAGDQLVCHECEDSESTGVIPMGSEFPYGDPPIHPNCRCAIYPLTASDLGPSGIADALSAGDLSPADLG